MTKRDVSFVMIFLVFFFSFFAKYHQEILLPITRMAATKASAIGSSGRVTYGSAGGLVVAALASHLEGDIVRGVALDLEGAGRQVVEVLVKELDRERDTNGKYWHVAQQNKGWLACGKNRSRPARRG